MRKFFWLILCIAFLLTGCRKAETVPVSGAVSMIQETAKFCKITSVEVRIPDSPAFDTYALKKASKDEIKSVEQGKK